MVNKPMKKACGLSTIDIIVTKKDGLWRANVSIGPIFEIPKALRDMGDLEGTKAGERPRMQAYAGVRNGLTYTLKRAAKPEDPVLWG